MLPLNTKGPPSPRAWTPPYQFILQCLFVAVVAWELFGRAESFTGSKRSRRAEGRIQQLEAQLSRSRVAEGLLQQRVNELESQDWEDTDTNETSSPGTAEPAQASAAPETVRAPTSNTTCNETMCEGSNSQGRWRWKPHGQHVDDMLVVIGGERQNVDTLLLDHGYKVWTSARACVKAQSKSCHESLGYVGYLADLDPHKPVARSVAFIHGHQQAWHQGERNITELLARGMRCGSRYRGYLPLHPEVHAPGLWQHAPFWSSVSNLWSRFFGGSPTPNRAVAPTSAQFILPEEFVRDNATFFSGKAQNLVRHGNTTGLFWEYMWHFAMGKDAVMDVHRLVPECFQSNDILEDTTYAARVRDTLQGTVVVDRYMQEIRTNNTGPKWQADVLVVIGNHLGDGTADTPHTAHPALVRKVQSMGYNVWLRHPELSACKLPANGKRTGPCYEDLGYLVYLSRPRTQQQVVVFLRGDEPLSFASRLPEAVECAREGKGYVALETNMTRADFDTEVARLASSKQKIAAERVASLYMQVERAHFPSLRNLPAVKHSKQWPPAPLKKDDLLVPRLGSHFAVSQELINKAPVDHYQVLLDTYGKSGSHERFAFAFFWHLVFGGTAHHPDPYGTELCVLQTLRPFQK